MENTQKIRHIPIFVEGRDEPVVNRRPESQSTANAPPPSSSNNTSAFASAESSSGPNHHSFTRPPMNFGADMGFGQDMPMPSGSIFERSKDFPVRDFFNMRSASPRRSESPSYMHHQATHQQPSRNSPGPQHHQPTPQSNQEYRQVPVQSEPKRSSTPQGQQVPQQVPQPAPEPEQQSVPAKQKAIEDSITKIQKIQASVLDLMSRVEKFDGSDRKEFLMIDELLTQNLIKLDDIDAEGKENIKNARREAIKCINSLISLLEAKNEAIKQAEGSNELQAVMEQQPELAQNGVSGASRNSSYDNVNNVKQTSSNSSVKADAVPSNVPAEVNLETKVQDALKKQEEEAKEIEQQQQK